MGILLTIIFCIFFLILFPLGEVARLDLPNNIAITGVDIGMGFFIILSILFFISRKKRSYSLFTPISLFLSVCVLSLVFQIFTLKQHELSVAFLYLLRFAAYTSIYFVICDISDGIKKRITMCMIASGCLLLIGGYIQFFFYPSLRNLYYLGWDVHLYRMFSSFLDPNFFGAFLVLYILFLLPFILKKSIQKNKLVFAGLLCLVIASLIALVLTYSRSAYIMGVVGVVSFFIMQKPSKKIIYSALLILAIGIGSYFFFTKYSEGTNLLRVTSTKARLTTSESALLIFEKNPLLGVGFNAYRYAQQRYGFIPKKHQNSTVDHGAAGTDSSLLFVLATTGILGFIAYIYLLGSIIYVQKKHLKQSYLASVIIASLIALCADSFFINSLFYPFIVLWLWSLVGLGEGVDKRIVKV